LAQLTFEIHCITTKSVRQVKLVWNKWNGEHIRKHEVFVVEARQAFNDQVIVLQSYRGRKVILGLTKKKRLLTLVLSFEKQKDAYVVSTRDASKKERKIYYAKAKTNKTI
jgi:uncharacterized DUF497 family protein